MNFLILSFLLCFLLITVAESLSITQQFQMNHCLPNEKRRRVGKKKEIKSVKDEPFKATFFNADILTCDDDYCFSINEFAVSNNYTFNCHNDFIQIDFLITPGNTSSKSYAFLHYDNMAITDYVQSQHCTIIKL